MNGAAAALGAMLSVYFLFVVVIGLVHCGLDGHCFAAAIDCAFGWCHAPGAL